jgi:hypothetical protein
LEWSCGQSVSSSLVSSYRFASRMRERYECSPMTHSCSIKTPPLRLPLPFAQHHQHFQLQKPKLQSMPPRHWLSTPIPKVPTPRHWHPPFVFPPQNQHFPSPPEAPIVPNWHSVVQHLPEVSHGPTQIEKSRLIHFITEPLEPPLNLCLRKTRSRSSSPFCTLSAVKRP